MKKSVALTLMLCLYVITGIQAKGMNSGPADDFADEQGTVVEYEGKQYVRVTNARQFLRSFISGKGILIARHTTINLTPLLSDKNWWQKNLNYFKWLPSYAAEDLTGQNIVSEEVNDGRQLAIVGYKNIDILGEGNSRIVVEPRYAFCLRLVNCVNISIRNLTIGHTDEGHCEGGVIGVSGGRSMSVQDCNLYGCGTYGLELKNTSHFTMYDSGIHDCTYGIMTLDNVTPAYFEGCNFYRNREFSLIEGTGSDITFDNCRFYANQETSPLFNIDRAFRLNYCLIMHPTEQLGNIEQAQQNNCWLSSELSDARGLGFDGDEFEGAGFGKEKIKVSYKGARPTVTDFINTISGFWEQDGEDGCYSWTKAWERYKKTKQTDPGNTFIVDERNGFVRLESKMEGSDYVTYHEFCYWNCADGQHKLFAYNNGMLDGGKAAASECTVGLYFYLYDNATNTIANLGFDIEVLGGRPDDDYMPLAYLLPRSGKDLTYINEKGKRGIVKWNGGGFSILRPITALPKSAKRMDAKGQLAVYINQEDEEMSTVWLVDEQNKTVEKVCTTRPASPGQWPRMMKPESDAVKVPLDNIASAERAWVIGEGRKIVVEGCRDQRNTLTYIIDAGLHRAWQLPSQEGVVSVDGAKHEIIVSTYGYDDEGRYSYNRAYSTEGQFLRMVGDKERE